MPPSAPTHSAHDIIVALPHHVVAHMLDHRIYELPRPWLYFPPIPPYIKRVWIYEDDPIEGITFMISLTPDGLPFHLYHLTNPLYKEHMGVYRFHRNYIPTAAPLRVIRRFRRRHRIQIW